MKNIFQSKTTFIWIVLTITLFGLFSVYIYHNHRYKIYSTLKNTLGHNNVSSQNKYSTSTVDENILAEKILPILNSYQSYLARQIDDNEVESLIISLKPYNSIDRKIRRLKSLIIISKSLSTHKLTGLITGENPLALIDGNPYRIGDNFDGCTLVNITSNYVTLQKCNLQCNLRIPKNLRPIKSAPKSQLARYSNSHEPEYRFYNTNSSPLSDNISGYLSMNYSDVNLDDNTLVGIDSIIWDTSTIPEVETVFSDDTINLSNKNINGKYLGQLGGNEFNPSSTRNPFGAGNQFNPDSISNHFGKYGSEFSPNSVRNPYAINTPKLYDSQGNYRGKLSSNPYDPDSISNPFGRYGNPFSPDSINNSFGAGNPFSPDSPRNPFGKGLAIYGDD